MATDYVVLTAEQRAEMERYLGGGLIGYLTRLREGHRPMFTEGRSQPLVYSGCSCGSVMCDKPLLLAHIEDVKAAYIAKVADLAGETAKRPFSMPCGWTGWDLNNHKLMHERKGESPNCEDPILRAAMMLCVQAGESGLLPCPAHLAEVRLAGGNDATRE